MSRFASLTLFAALAGAFHVDAASILYGVNGSHGGLPVTAPDGALVTVDQSSGTTTVIGQSGFSRLSGLGISANGTLYATTLGPGGFPPGPGFITSSDLVTLSPSNGSVLNDIGTVRLGTTTGPALAIADLAFQPGTGVLFAVTNDKGSGAPGSLYTVNTTNAVATLLNGSEKFFGSIAFTPGGLLYEVGADFDPASGPVSPVLLRLDPANGNQIGNSVPLSEYFGAFGIRPTDGTFFVGNGDGGQIFNLNPSTGLATLTGSTGSSFVGDLDFFTVPEPGNLWWLTGLIITIVAWRADHRAACGGSPNGLSVALPGSGGAVSNSRRAAE